MRQGIEFAGLEKVLLVDGEALGHQRGGLGLYERIDACLAACSMGQLRVSSDLKPVLRVNAAWLTGLGLDVDDPAAYVKQVDPALNPDTGDLAHDM